MKINHVIYLVLAAGFIFVGIMAYQNAKPSDKNQRVYSELRGYMPYVIEKRFGGLSIVSKITGKKEKPPSSEFYKRLDQLEVMWGKEHLKIVGEELIISDENGTEVGKISLLDNQEKSWVKVFFGL